jgi:hypothetical protein
MLPAVADAVAALVTAHAGLARPDAAGRSITLPAS